MHLSSIFYKKNNFFLSTEPCVSRSLLTRTIIFFINASVCITKRPSRISPLSRAYHIWYSPDADTVSMRRRCLSVPSGHRLKYFCRNPPRAVASEKNFEISGTYGLPLQEASPSENKPQRFAPLNSLRLASRRSGIIKFYWRAKTCGINGLAALSPFSP